MKPALDPAVSEEFGPYVVYERLGMGGMAVVHRAKKQGIAGFERKLALKRLLPHLAEDAEFVQSFIREAKVASLLVHPNIAQIYDFGRIEGVYYIAMEHVDGFDVRKLLRFANRSGEHIPLGVVLSILIELCDALEYAHTFVDETGTPMGLVHRDVSPSNLIVAQTGHLKVIDFGIAKAESRQLHTESGRVKGKLGYMSPEAAMGAVYGPVSDVFSAGVVAYELLTASPLFSAKTDFETMLRIREAEVLPPSKKNPEVPQELDDVILHALHRNAASRIQTAGEFRMALDQVSRAANIRLQSRDVSEWMLRFAQPEDTWARNSARTPATGYSNPRVSSQMAAGEQTATSNLRPHSPSRTPMPIPDAHESWDDPKPPPPGDFTISSQGSSSRDPAPVPAAVSHSGSLAQSPITLPVAPSRSRAPLAILVLLILIAGGLAAYLVLFKNKAKPTAPVSTQASLNFVIQPAGAIIEIGGKEVARQSPYEAQLGPGMYSISVTQEGFKKWTTSITLRDGDHQTINVALERGTALVNVDSQPRGLVVEIDGVPTTQRTPAKLTVPSGPHKLSITNATGQTWSQDLVAAVDGNYNFIAPLKPEKDKPDDRPPTRPTGNNKHKNPQIAEKTPPEKTPILPDHSGSGSNATGSGSATVPEVKPEIKPEVKPPPPPPPPPPVKHPTQTAIVAAGSVTKVSGELPAIKVRGGNDSNGDVIVKICINENGGVTSVTAKKTTPEIANALSSAIMGWRYKPYLNKDKQPSPACFVLNLRVVVKGF